MICELCGNSVFFSQENNGWICFNDSCPNSKKAKTIMCDKCGKRKATCIWIGEGGMLASAHGFCERTSKASFYFGKRIGRVEK